MENSGANCFLALLHYTVMFCIAMISLIKAAIQNIQLMYCYDSVHVQCVTQKVT
uniref:Uncharacterized protein n=1 Tax=Arundo donax TaxID=35708 RepID=A0A0A8YJA5_ARUDO